MSDYVTPTKAPSCIKCGKPKTVNGRGNWICEPCRIKSCIGGRKSLAALAEEAGTPGICPKHKDPLVMGSKGRLRCVTCRREADRRRYAAEQANLADLRAVNKPVVPIVDDTCDSDFVPSETVRRIQEAIDLGSIPLRINPERLRNGVLYPGQPLYVPSTSRYARGGDAKS